MDTIKGSTESITTKTKRSVNKMYLLKNITGYEIEIDDQSYQPDQEIELNQLPSTKDIIVYNDGDCNVFISDGYVTHNGITVCEIYIS